jgi:hypothetical protein
MEIENNLNNNITEEKDQKSFLETSIGKVVDSAIDVGLRMLLPDVIEDGIIEVKDSLLKEGLKEGINTAINGAIDLGKSIKGIFTGNFENVTQARDAIKSGGIIDGISDVLDSVIDKTKEKGIIDNNIASIIENGKDSLLNNISSKIEAEFTKQIEMVDELDKNEEKWKESFNNKDFNGMEEVFEKIEKNLQEVLPIENIIKEARTIENLHNLIKNNGQNFDLSDEEIELANMLN